MSRSGGASHLELFQLAQRLENAPAPPTASILPPLTVAGLLGIAARAPKLPNGEPDPEGLARGLEDEERLSRGGFNSAWHREVDRHVLAEMACPAGQWVQGLSGYREFKDAVLRARRRSVEAREAERAIRGDMWSTVLSAAVWSLGLYRRFQETGDKPKLETARVRSKAIKAIKALEACQKDGLDIRRYLPPDLLSRPIWMPLGWLQSVREGIEQAATQGPRSYSGGDLRARAAIEDFYSKLTSRYDTVPRVFVIKFAYMIGMNQEAAIKVYGKLKARKSEVPRI